MKSFVLLLLLPLVGLLCSCSGTKEPRQPVAAAFEYSENKGKSAQAPLFVLYDNGSLIFRKQNGNRFDYLRLDLDENEQAEILAHVENVVREPGLKDRYALSPEAPTPYGSAFVFFGEKASSVIQVDDLKPIEVSSLRLAESPDFSGDESFPNSLIQYILTMGMLRVSAADEWKSGSADLEHLFPGQERWNSLKFDSKEKGPIELSSGPTGLRINRESIKAKFKPEATAPVKVNP